MEPNIDLIGLNGGQGIFAARMQAEGRLDPNRMRPFIGKNGKAYYSVYKGGDIDDPANYKVVPAIGVNATLRRDEWKALDDVVVEVQKERIGGFDDLAANNLVYNLNNAMGTTVLEWHDISSQLTAELSMDAVTRAKSDRPKFQFNYLPIPILHVDYEINDRQLQTSRNSGNALDTTLAAEATRTIRNALEDMLFTDTSYSYGEKDSRLRNTIYSYVNFPDRNQVTMATHWDDSSMTGKDIVDQIISLKKTLIAAKFYGPYQLYIPTDYETLMDQDYVGSTPDSNANTTLRSRIMAIEGIKGMKVIDRLPAHNVLMIQMTSNVVRLVNGLGIQNVEWDAEGKFVHKFKVLTIQVPQLRSDQEGNCGILHLAPA